MATQLVCIEHGLRVSGCDCAGAIIKKVPCPGKHLTSKKAAPVRKFSLNITEEEHELAMKAYKERVI